MSEISTSRIQLQQQLDIFDYLELLKPRVMRLVVFTAFVGLFVAPSHVPLSISIIAILCIALGAGASGALNMYYDADIDKLMDRTSGRPIPSGRIMSKDALAIGVVLSVFSVAMLGLFTNWFAATFLAFTIIFYAVFYTMFLKRSTPQNIVIGGAAGAFPPMIGWAVATGGIAFESILMFLVIFFWTPPHFWALALFRQDDYKAASVPMYPNIYGERKTRVQILLYSLILFVTTLVTSFSAIGGYVTLLLSIVLGGLFLFSSAAMLNRQKEDGFLLEKRYFGLSIIYLFLFFLALIADKILIQWIGIEFLWRLF